MPRARCCATFGMPVVPPVWKYGADPVVERLREVERPGVLRRHLAAQVEHPRLVRRRVLRRGSAARSRRAAARGSARGRPPARSRPRARAPRASATFCARSVFGNGVSVTTTLAPVLAQDVGHMLGREQRVDRRDDPGGRAGEQHDRRSRRRSAARRRRCPPARRRAGGRGWRPASPPPASRPRSASDRLSRGPDLQLEGDRRSIGKARSGRR